MSGVEVLGIVLGVLPLIISAAEDYKKGFEPLVRWKKFRFVFREFITSVDIQRQMFHLVLKRLLIRVPLPPEEKQKLSTVPNYQGWSQPATVDAMKVRLGDSYKACMEILRAMKEDMQELQTMMSLKDGSVDWAHPGEKQWKYQAKRIQLSFSEKGTRTVQSLEKKISDLNNLLSLLDSTDDESGTKGVSRDTTWAKLFECIRRHAINLHYAIKLGWKCSCEGTHLAGLQLQKRAVNESGARFTMTFGASGLPGTQKQKRVLVVLEESRTGQVVPPKSLNGSAAAVSYLDTLRVDFDSRSSSQSVTITNSVHARPAFTSSSSSMSSRLTSFGSIFSKSDSSLTISSISTSTASRTEVLVQSEQSLKTPNLALRPKAKKGISFAMDLPAEAKDPGSGPTSTPSNQHVSFPDTPSVPEETSAEVEIGDLCSTLRDLDPKATKLGYLSDHEKRMHEITCLTEAVIDSANLDLISLEELLAKDGHIRLTRQKRYKVACILASSLLQLETTPWLRGSLDKEKILFYHNGTEVMVDQPYLSHSFPSTKATHCPSGETTTETQNINSPRASLSSLGILLLELCWGQTIESQTNLRNKHLSSDGKAIGGTDYLTAIDWLDTVDEEEPRMGPIIKWCIFCLYEGKPNWADSNFTQAVYTNVVRPLEMLVVQA
ncbi:uncharacterized protein LY89DRAFT_683078 [Mollisia scopiformis]|uniref:DUF7580 domain-containing protein n=1 Tax=Mollisia scopiformis TaxID=149040 RepID=A0A194XG82_MOLSC|nr:uncharacterized protein LY89DRAFT_683078 [Mollisia scopiformis]KUJ19144.1 hypothetical protein LY89DRAFT_683078 [Mollisia scopiformis]